MSASLLESPGLTAADLALLVEAAVPAASLEIALGRLAAAWCRALPVCACQLIVTTDDGEISGTCNRGQPPTVERHASWVFSGHSPAEEVATADRALVRQLPPTAPDSSATLPRTLVPPAGCDSRAKWVRLDFEGETIATAAVYLANHETTWECPETWRRTTARLIAHFRRLDDCLLQAKLRALAEFAAGAGHEINNPLTAIVRYADLLGQDETDPERRHMLHTIGGQAYRIRDMIGDVMLFARPPQPQPESLDLSAEVHGVLARFAEAAASRRITLTGPQSTSTPIWADRTQLAVVVSELVSNALNAVGEKGCISVATAGRTQHDAPVAVLTVSDDGRGCTAKEREHLFDPFFSGREAGRGLGFGLSKCWRIIRQHGGRIAVQSGSAGTTFRVEWPAANPHASSPTAISEPSATTENGKGTVL